MHFNVKIYSEILTRAHFFLPSLKTIATISNSLVCCLNFMIPINGFRVQFSFIISFRCLSHFIRFSVFLSENHFTHFSLVFFSRFLDICQTYLVIVVLLISRRIVVEHFNVCIAFFYIISTNIISFSSLVAHFYCLLFDFD